MALKIGAEDPEFRRLRDILLPAGQLHELLSQGAIGDTDDRGTLQEAGRRGGTRRLEDRQTLRLADRFGTKLANGTVIAQQIDGRDHELASSLMSRVNE